MQWKKAGPMHSGAPANRIEALACLLQEDGGLEKLEAALAELDPASLGDAERERWYHLRGIVPFRRGNRALAFERFGEAADQYPASGPIQFSLGQEYEFRGDPDRMLECFDRAPFPGIPAEYALSQARYAYLWNRFDKGRAYIEPLLPIYFDLRILDTTFLYLRGLPFFEEVWAILAAFSLLEDNISYLDAITERVEAECSELDFGLLRAEHLGYRDGDFAPLKKCLRDSIRESKGKGYPFGCQALRLGILLSRETGDREEAARLLDSVMLEAKDFPWLEDIRLLAHCDLAHRSGETAAEMEMRGRFLARQTMLFEPGNALNFFLLEYQETLKADYRRTRTRAGVS